MQHILAYLPQAFQVVARATLLLAARVQCPTCHCAPVITCGGSDLLVQAELPTYGFWSGVFCGVTVVSCVWIYFLIPKRSLSAAQIAIRKHVR